jgi:hypothetical protein
MSAVRFQAETFRVKANRWIDVTLTDDEDVIVPAHKAASHLGNGWGARRYLKSRGFALIIPAMGAEVYYKSCIGILTMHPSGPGTTVRLETLNTDGLTGLPAVQFAILHCRERNGKTQVKFI